MNRSSQIFAPPGDAAKPRKAPSATPADKRGTDEARKRDIETFSRFLNGDDRALVELFDRHNHRLFSYCLQFVHDQQRAEDITQELWERLIRLRSKGSLNADNPAGLLLTMTRNLCLDALRKDRKHSDIEELADTSHPVDSIPELSHMEELVILALPHLPVAQREVLMLNAYSGYRFDEIAEMLGEPVGAIRTRAWRARTHLARIISVMIGLEQDNERDAEHPSQGNQRGNV
jgi:RNA polymerase sigma-70 factor (ECF subfamily)